MESYLAAGIGAVGLIIQGIITSRRTDRAVREVHKSIGSPNGKGNVTEMLERLDDRTVRLEDRASRTEERLFRIETKVTEGSRLDRIEEKRVQDRQDP